MSIQNDATSVNNLLDIDVDISTTRLPARFNHTFAYNELY